MGNEGWRLKKILLYPVSLGFQLSCFPIYVIILLSITRVSEVESSVRSLRRQQEALQLRLKEEGQRKEELEQKITQDQRKIRELEIKLKV